VNNTNKLTSYDLEVFLGLGIDAALLERAGIRRVTDQEARQEFGVNDTGNNSGILFLTSMPEEFAGRPGFAVTTLTWRMVRRSGSTWLHTATGVTCTLFQATIISGRTRRFPL